MVTLHLQPIFYQHLDESWLPNKKPYAHQVEILHRAEQAISNREFLCLFNTSATGGGKTLASYAYAIIHDKPVVGVYPTNELIEDQHRALASEFQTRNRSDLLIKVNSHELDRWEIDINRHGHARTLETLLGWNGAILTNPDIIYLTFFGLYGDSKHAPGINQRLFQAFSDAYSIFVFDEFHLYNVKQVGNIVSIIGALHAIQKGRAKVFIFSSATPHPPLIEALGKLGIQSIEVKAEEVNSTDSNSRMVSHPIELKILPADLARWKILEALEADAAPLLREFLQRYPDAKSVSILDGVADALLWSKRLQTEFGNHNVGEIHGLSSEEARNNAIRKIHTVGTSTIEVGIDFKGNLEKDMLLFESKTAAQFIQRLGRIGRHSKSRSMPNIAIALVPPHVHESLKQQFGEDALINRAQLTKSIFDAYRNPNEFRGYFRRYTPVEVYALRQFISAQFHRDLRTPEADDDRSAIQGALDSMIEMISDRNIDKVKSQYWGMKNRKLLKPLQSFRSSGFDVALFDRMERQGNPIKIYDLIFVLRRGKFREMRKEEFFSQINGLSDPNSDNIRLLKRRLSLVQPDVEEMIGVYDYIDLNDILDEPRKVWLEVFEDELPEEFDKELCQIKSLEIATEPSVNLPWLSRTIGKKSLVCRIVREKPWTLRFSKALPPLFEVYELRVKNMYGNVRYYCSIAFGQNAYFLDCLSYEDSNME